MSNYNFKRPNELFVSQNKESIEGTCPECAEADLKRYPVLSDEGWLLVVKCQQCLFSISRKKWNRLGHIKLETDRLFPEKIES